MKFGINTIDDFNLEGKVIICRVDMNQPINKENEKLLSTHRIEACVPTLKEISEKNAKLVVLCHQGSDIEYKNYYNTKPHSKVLSMLLNKQVKWIDDVCGPSARKEITSLKNGEILLLDNVRFVAEEMTLFETNLKLDHKQQSQTEVVKKLAPLADLYVCDAFAAAHRDQPSLCGFEQILPSAMGRLFEREYVEISKLLQCPKHPCTFVLGGAKISDAFIMMETVLNNKSADKVLVGGLAGQVVLAAKGIDIGYSNINFIKNKGFAKYIDTTITLLKKYKDKIISPVDVSYIENNKRINTNIDNIPNNHNIIDIGDKTIEIFSKEIEKSSTIFANGPMGIFEKELSEKGTKEVYNAIAKSKGHSVIGGGDSVTAVNKYNIANNLDYICTGGGALIRFLSGVELPVVKALRYSANKFN